MNWISLTEQIVLKIIKEFINLITNFITIILFPCLVKQLSYFLTLCLATLWIVSCFSQMCCSQRSVVIRLELKLCHWHELQDVFIINTENPVMLWTCWIKGKIKGILPVKTLVQNSQFILHWMTMCHWFLKRGRQLPSLYWTSLATLNLLSVSNLLLVQTPYGTSCDRHVVLHCYIIERIECAFTRCFYQWWRHLLVRVWWTKKMVPQQNARFNPGNPTGKMCFAELGLKPLPMAWIASMLSAPSIFRLTLVIGRLQTVAIISKAHTAKSRSDQSLMDSLPKAA